jgi:uncharacterized membrane protein
MSPATTSYRPVCFCVWWQCFLQKYVAEKWGFLCLAFLSVCIQSLIISGGAVWKRAALGGILAVLLLMLPAVNTNGDYMVILV